MSATAIGGVRVAETTTTTGTGTLDLAGAVTAYQGFVAGIGDGQLCEYVIEDANGSGWEHGIGTITDAATDTLARTTVLASSNAGSAITLTSGTHTVYATPGARTLNRLTLPVVAITDAAVTMVVNRCYRGSISAWATADRIYTLPDTAAVGDRIRIELTAGNASTFELLVKTAATGSLVNGVDASSTEWSRLFITGESAEFVCVNAGGSGDTDWIVAEDGRIPCYGDMYVSTAETTNSAATWTKCGATAGAFTSIVDRGNVVSTANKRIVARRAGKWVVDGSARPNASISAANYYGVGVDQDGAGSPNIGGLRTTSNSGSTDTNCSGFVNLTAGGYVELYFLSQEANRGVTNVRYTSRLMGQEVL